jgi:hypothetical protein
MISYWAPQSMARCKLVISLLQSLLDMVFGPIDPEWTVVNGYPDS